MSDPPEGQHPVDPWAAPPDSAPPAQGPPPTSGPGAGQGCGPGAGQGYGQGYGPGAYAVSPPRADPMAAAAMWSGIGLLVLSCCGVGLLGVVPVVLGARSRGRIRRSGGGWTGDGMALAGIILGVLAVVVSLAVIALVAALVIGGRATLDGYGTTRV